ncbi:MAG: DUF4440 domain-containing protein [Planctomycetota bacterium]
MPSRLILILCAALGGPATVARAQTPADSDETARIEQAIEAYVSAFNARDVPRLISLWSDEGVYLTGSTGAPVVGQAAMTEEFKAILGDDAAPKLAVATESIEFISPSVALERGRATLAYADGEAVETTYRAVFVKQGDAWLIDRVTEDNVTAEDKRYERLRQLDWLVGEWRDRGDGQTVEVSCRWTKNNAFLSRTYVVSAGGRPASSGLQVIGWDAKSDQIVSWLFDSDGGVVTGEWSQRDGVWSVVSKVTLADGGSGSFTSILRPLNGDSFAWKKVQRVLDGELLPNVGEIVFERQ